MQATRKTNQPQRYIASTITSRRKTSTSVLDYNKRDGYDMKYGEAIDSKILIPELELAHNTVKEYLMSDRVYAKLKESLSESQSRAYLVKICLT